MIKGYNVGQGFKLKTKQNEEGRIYVSRCLELGFVEDNV